MSIAAFRSAVEGHDHAAIVACLADDVVFCSPAVFKPYEGREATAFVLSGVVQVLEDFQYIDEIDAGDRGLLRFVARVGDRRIEGVDLLTLDDEGRVTELTVMIRPLSGLNAVVAAMGEALAALQAAGDAATT